MFRTLLVALALGAASAFMGAPVAHRAASAGKVSMMAKIGLTPPPGAKLYDDALGAQKPLGYFDPLGLLTNADQERFDRLRTVELKHGRISMLAVLGHLVTGAGIRLPGYLSNSADLQFSDVSAGLKVFETLPTAGLAQIIAFVGFLEIKVMRDVTGLAEFPGDYRNGIDPFNWDKFDDATKLKKRAIELNNGRAAQMGILALMVHEVIDNNPYIFFPWNY